MILEENIAEDIRNHAKEEYPRECCGVVLVVKGKQRYFKCKNIAQSAEHFILDPLDWVAAEDLGTPLAIVHSHPNIPPVPSQADLVGCEQSKLPWIIVNHPVGNMNIIEPNGYKAPLVGREFSHGILDCFSIVQDYYKEVLGIELDTPYREEEWWTKGQNLYLDNAERWGFVPVTDIQLHDVILMRISSPVPNHAGVFIGDDKILHHQTHRLSSRDIYGGWYRKITTNIFRHKELIK